MAAPSNNKFWKKRSKHGRDKIFATPEILKEACYEYFEHQSKNKWEKTDYKGKEVEMVKIPTSSPFTIKGLCLFLGVNSKFINQFESGLDLTTEEGHDFSNIITHVREIIFIHKFEGAVVGAYNSNIIARELGLTDKKEVNTSGSLTISQPQGIELPPNGED